MPVQLAKPIAAYFSSENVGDAEASTACFTADATVRDEARTMQGLAAIEQWRVAAKKKYQHTVEPLDATERDGNTVVTVKVSGNFPGSPVNLQYVFGLKSGKIASLEIS